MPCLITRKVNWWRMWTTIRTMNKTMKTNLIMKFNRNVRLSHRTLWMSIVCQRIIFQETIVYRRDWATTRTTELPIESECYREEDIPVQDDNPIMAKKWWKKITSEDRGKFATETSSDRNFPWALLFIRIQIFLFVPFSDIISCSGYSFSYSYSCYGFLVLFLFEWPVFFLFAHRNVCVRVFVYMCDFSRFTPFI